MAGEQGRGGAVGEHYMRMIRGDEEYDADGCQHHQEKPGAAVSVAKGVAAAAAAGTMLALAGLTVTGTVLALVVATPLLVLFSPVLSPSGEHEPAGVGKVEHARALLDAKAHDVGDWVQHRLDQART
uniref:Oleosin n=1 Tax=Oryza punctata TaxID=4537 RepID=A0A0E0LZU0_ORYPU